MIRRAIGRGKLILFGEHAAVYGYPAVGTSLAFHTALSFKPLRLNQSRYEYDNADASAVRTPGETETDRNVFLSILHDLDLLSDTIGGPGIWRRTGDVPRAGGFGSSAALCVALSRIALNRLGDCYDTEVHRLANALERRFHGTPSGIDTGMACDSGAAVWEFTDSALPERRPLVVPDWNLIYGALPRTAPTGETVGNLRKKRGNGDSCASARLDDLGAISAEFGELAIKAPNDFRDRAAKLVNRAQKSLSALGLSVPQLDRILEIALEEGASGGKLSGGGSGGAFYLCAPDKPARDRLLKVLAVRLKNEGISLTVNLTPLDFPGAKKFRRGGKTIDVPENLPRKPPGHR